MEAHARLRARARTSVVASEGACTWSNLDGEEEPRHSPCRRDAFSIRRQRAAGGRGDSAAPALHDGVRAAQGTLGAVAARRGSAADPWGASTAASARGDADTARCGRRAGSSRKRAARGAGSRAARRGDAGAVVPAAGRLARDGATLRWLQPSAKAASGGRGAPVRRPDRRAGRAARVVALDGRGGDARRCAAASAEPRRCRRGAVPASHGAALFAENRRFVLVDAGSAHLADHAVEHDIGDLAIDDQGERVALRRGDRFGEASRCWCATSRRRAASAIDRRHPWNPWCTIRLAPRRSRRRPGSRCRSRGRIRRDDGDASRHRRPSAARGSREIAGADEIDPLLASYRELVLAHAALRDRARLGRGPHRVSRTRRRCRSAARSRA